LNEEKVKTINPATEEVLNEYRIMNKEQIYTGTLSEMVELVSLARRGVIKPLVSNRFRLNQATEALTMLKEGKILGRGVINP
jgi:propanol-preferring alcohol dehydrogenase